MKNLLALKLSNLMKLAMISHPLEKVNEGGFKLENYFSKNVFQI